MHSTYLDAILKKAETHANQKLNEETKKYLSSIPESETRCGYEFEHKKQQELLEIRSTVYKEKLKGLLKDDFEKLQQLTALPGWQVFQNLVFTLEEDKQDFSSHLERMAFYGHKKLITAEIMDQPYKVLAMYKEIGE